VCKRECVNDLILVTGATGTIGRDVVKELARRGAKVSAGVRDKAKASTLFPPEVELVEFDFENAGTLSNALKGVTKLFVLPPLIPNQTETVNRLIDVAKKSGLKKIVKLSAIGTETELSFTVGNLHAATDQYIRESGVAHTLLRPNSFMQNFINYFPPRNGIIYLPWGNGKASFIDARDIASVAAEILTSGEHRGKIYTLTGPTALGVADVAKILSDASGREIKYTDVPESAARDGMLQAGLPQWQVDALMELHAINKQSLWSAVTSDIENIIGRPPTSFEQFARDYATRF
jgi:uncharacterized protein YbjT (DUF2867 family)